MVLRHAARVSSFVSTREIREVVGGCQKTALVVSCDTAERSPQCPKVSVAALNMFAAEVPDSLFWITSLQLVHELDHPLQSALVHQDRPSWTSVFVAKAVAEAPVVANGLGAEATVELFVEGELCCHAFPNRRWHGTARRVAPA